MRMRDTISPTADKDNITSLAFAGIKYAITAHAINNIHDRKRGRFENMSILRRFPYLTFCDNL